MKPRTYRFGYGVMLLAGALLALPAWASHFRFAHIPWKPRTDIAPTAIEFNYSGAFRRDGYPGSTADGFPQTGDIILETQGDTEFCFGDGQCSGVLSFVVTAFDPAQNSLIGQAVTTATGVTVNEQEPNDAAPTANLSNLGDDFSGVITPGGNSDFVRFFVPARTRIHAQTTLGTLGDSVLTLYAPDGVTVIETNDDGGPGSASEIDRTLQVEGFYFLEVDSFSDGDSGSYGLLLRGGRNVQPLVHSYPSTGDFLAFIDTGDRIAACDPPNAHINNPERNYRVETMVNVGSGNSSPVSSLPPIVLCPQNGLCRFSIPTADDEADSLSFRLSTPAESQLVAQPGPPACPNAATVDPATGVYSWNTTGCVLGTDSCGPGFNTLYSTQVTIEDQTSKSAIDFFVQLVACPPSNNTPVFSNQPAPVCGTTIPVRAGSQVTFPVQAMDSDSGDTVQLNSAGLPLGAVMTPALPTSGNPVGSTFSWMPTAAQAGQQLVTFAAADQCGAQALCSVTLDVSAGNFEDCADGRDNDNDNLIDLLDPECPSSPLALKRGGLTLSPILNKDSITLSGSFVTPTNSINPPVEGVRLSLIDADGRIVFMTIPPGLGWKTKPGPSWSFKDAKDDSLGDPQADEKISIKFNKKTGAFTLTVNIKEAELLDPDAGVISTSLIIGDNGFLNTQPWRTQAKGKKLTTP